MRRLGLSLLLVLWPLAASAERPRELDDAFLDPTVSVVALVPYRADCKPCIAALPSWRRLSAEERKNGLRIFAWLEDPSGRCTPPPMKVDKLVCDRRQSLRKALGLGAEDHALIYTFEQTAALVSGPPKEAQKAASSWIARRPQLRFEIEGDRSFTDAFRDALGSMTRTRATEGALGAIAENMPCGRSSLPSQLWLRIRQSKDGGSVVLAPAGGACVLDQRRFDYEARRARASAAAAMSELIPAWPVAPAQAAADWKPAAEAPASPPPGAETALTSLSEGLRAFAERWRGTRHRLGADGTDGTGIDGPHFVDRAYQEVLGQPLATTLNELYALPAQSIEPSREAPERDLRPGDLVFLTTHADQPRQVMLYLGGGLVAQSIEVRGVVIEPLPKNLPDMFWMVGRRPNPGPGPKPTE